MRRGLRTCAQQDVVRCAQSVGDALKLARLYVAHTALDVGHGLCIGKAGLHRQLVLCEPGAVSRPAHRRSKRFLARHRCSLFRIIFGVKITFGPG